MPIEVFILLVFFMLLTILCCLIFSDVELSLRVPFTEFRLHGRKPRSRRRNKDSLS